MGIERNVTGIEQVLRKWAADHAHLLPKEVTDRWTQLVRVNTDLTVENLTAIGRNLIILADPRDEELAKRRLFKAAKNLLQAAGILPPDHPRHDHDRHAQNQYRSDYGAY